MLQGKPWVMRLFPRTSTSEILHLPFIKWPLYCQAPLYLSIFQVCFRSFRHGYLWEYSWRKNKLIFWGVDQTWHQNTLLSFISWKDILEYWCLSVFILNKVVLESLGVNSFIGYLGFTSTLFPKINTNKKWLVNQDFWLFSNPLISHMTAIEPVTWKKIGRSKTHHVSKLVGPLLASVQ